MSRANFAMKRSTLMVFCVLLLAIAWINGVSAQSSPSPYTYATRYDLMGRVTGTIAPDPDGGGPLHYLAVRNTYDPAGRLTRVESGELSAWYSENTAPENWTGFTIYKSVETTYDGIGFGLGLATTLGEVAAGSFGAGDYFWGGLASTIFWVDPKEDLVVIFMTQFIPSATFNFRGQLKNIIYSAMVD